MKIQDVFAEMQKEEELENSQRRLRHKTLKSALVGRSAALPANQMTYNFQPGVDHSNSINKKSDEQISAQSILLNLSREFSSLTVSSDPTIRRRNLLKIYKDIFQGSAGIVTPQALNEIFSEKFKVFCEVLDSDRTESCREVTLKIIISAFEHLTDFSVVLGFFFSTILKRLLSTFGFDSQLNIFVVSEEEHQAYLRGRAIDRQDKLVLAATAAAQPIPSPASLPGIKENCCFERIEFSEELRLLTVKSLTTLIRRLISINQHESLSPFFHETILCLHHQLSDPFPDIKLEVCSVFVDMSQVNFLRVGMKYYAIGLSRGILPHLRHRHAKVRLGVLKMLTACVMIPDTAKQVTAS
jgi:hypothetical protein